MPAAIWPNRDHFLALNQRLLVALQGLIHAQDLALGPLSLRDVPKDAGVHGPVGELHLADGQVNRHQAAVPSLPDDLAPDADDLRLTGRAIGLDVLVVPAAVGLGHDLVDAAANHVTRLIAEDPLGGGVGREHDPLVADGDDPLDRRIEDGPELFVLATQRRLAVAKVIGDAAGEKRREQKD